MGGKWSKNRGWSAVREKIERTEPAEGVGAASRDLGKHGAITSSNTAATNAACAWLEAQQEGEEVGFPVRPQVPTRPMTYRAAVELSNFLKEKGGLEGLIWSQQRQDILDMWVYNTQGYLPDWQNYTPGPGTRYPLTFGWCFKLVPIESDSEEENNSLLHPMGQHGMDDPEKEVLKWKFDSKLAVHHVARMMHPEFYKDC
nr:nef protein [Human immunodeficiency virus 1]